MYWKCNLTGVKDGPRGYVAEGMCKEGMYKEGMCKEGRCKEGRCKVGVYRTGMRRRVSVDRQLTGVKDGPRGRDFGLSGRIFIQSSVQCTVPKSRKGK